MKYITIGRHNRIIILKAGDNGATLFKPTYQQVIDMRAMGIRIHRGRTAMREVQHAFFNWYCRLRAAVIGQFLVWAAKLMAGNLRIYGFDHILECRRQGRPIIFAGWHGHNLVNMAAYYSVLRKDFKCAIMVPEIADGMVLDHLGRKIDIDVVKVRSELGPSQWARATAVMIKYIRGGHCALLSPDGPNGPACKVKPGIVLMGQKSDAVVIPASVASRGAVKLRKRWDMHLVPMPWSRTVIHFGAPIDVRLSDGSRPCSEELQATIEEALNKGAQWAEKLCQRSLGKPKEFRAAPL